MISWLIFSTACGFRTPPEPYDQPDNTYTISTISQTSLKVQGDNWVFRWKIPPVQALEKDELLITEPSRNDLPEKIPVISIIRINFLKATSECPFCKPDNLGHFLIDLNNREIESDFPEGTTLPPDPQFFISGGVNYRFNLPFAFFKDNGFIDHCFFTIDYYLDNGMLSVPSQRLYPLDLNTLPLPKVRFRTRVSNIRPERLLRVDSYLIKSLNRFLFEIPADIAGTTTTAVESSESEQNDTFSLLKYSEEEFILPKKTETEDNPLDYLDEIYGLLPYAEEDYNLTKKTETEDNPLDHLDETYGLLAYAEAEYDPTKKTNKEYTPPEKADVEHDPLEYADETLLQATYYPLMPPPGPQTVQSVLSDINLEAEPYSDKCEKAEEDKKNPQFEYFLLLDWDLKQETLRHTLQKDRKLSEQVVHYGINFYYKQIKTPLPERLDNDHNPLDYLDETYNILVYAEEKYEPPAKADDEDNLLDFLDETYGILIFAEEAYNSPNVGGADPFQHTEHLINPQPLLYGSYSLFNFQGELLARHVDRFGNESESILVFDGEYYPFRENQ